MYYGGSGLAGNSIQVLDGTTTGRYAALGFGLAIILWMVVCAALAYRLTDTARYTDEGTVKKILFFLYFPYLFYSRQLAQGGRQGHQAASHDLCVADDHLRLVPVHHVCVHRRCAVVPRDVVRVRDHDEYGSQPRHQRVLHRVLVRRSPQIKT